GTVVEEGETEKIFENPEHPYTEGLIKSMPKIGSKQSRLYAITGQVPDPAKMPKGCKFADRCPYVMDICREEEPALMEGSDGRKLTAKEILEVDRLKKYFPISRGLFAKKDYVKAVDDVSFSIKKGDTVSIVGESGCGKSTLARLVNGLIQADTGKIVFKDHDLTHESEETWRSFRQPMQMIFQDPYASLSPKMKIKDLVGEPLKIHRPDMSAADREKTVRETLDICGIGQHHLEKHPHQFSGGQRQRIGIARALVLR